MRLEDWLKYVEQVEKEQTQQPVDSKKEEKQESKSGSPSSAAEPSQQKAETKPATQGSVAAIIERPVVPSDAARPVEKDEVVARPASPAPEPSARDKQPTQQRLPVIDEDDADLHIPEIEEFMPFLKGKDSSQQKPGEKKPEEPAKASAPPVQSRPAVPSERDTGKPIPEQRKQATPEVREKPAQPVQPPVQKAEPVTRQEVPAEPPAGKNGHPPAAPKAEAKQSQPVARVEPKTEKPPAQASVTEPQVSAEERPQDQSGLDRLPRHIQSLANIKASEVAQHSYKRGFRESREELLERLLDPPLSLEDAARVLNVCPTTVRRYTNKGLLPHYRTAGNQRRFRLSDVIAFMESLAGKQGRGRKKSQPAQDTQEGEE